MHMLVTVILERFRDTMLKIRESSEDKPVEAPDEALESKKRENSIQRHMQAIDQIRLEQQLAQAVEDNEFELHFQPIIDMGSRQVAGFESLIRWNMPGKGLVYPGLFIQTAEDSGIVVEMGRWIMAKAAESLEHLRKVAQAN